MKRIAIVTSGGDAPGMNAAIRAVVRSAIPAGMEVFGFHQGYGGLLENKIIQLNLRSVSGIINRGGTMLRTKRCAEIRSRAGIVRAVSVLRQHRVDALVVIGGDGSRAAAEKISKYGVPAVFIPGSIDNDIYGTDETIGYDTAMDTSMEAIDKIRDTAASHERVFIVEVMGREHGFLALGVGIASGAEFILIPEIKTNARKLASEIKVLHRRGKTSIIIVFAEGAGNPYVLAKKLEGFGIKEVRVSSLGYIQRGGAPSARSRILATCFGVHAVELLRKGKANRAVVLSKGKVSDIPLSVPIGKKKTIDMNMYNMLKSVSV